MERPLFYEEHKSKEIKNIDAFVHVERKNWDISCFYFDGIPFTTHILMLLKLILKFYFLVDIQTQSSNVKPTS